jgi:hypothetical protein
MTVRLTFNFGERYLWFNQRKDMSSSNLRGIFTSDFALRFSGLLASPWPLQNVMNSDFALSCVFRNNDQLIVCENAMQKRIATMDIIMKLGARNRDAKS